MAFILCGFTACENEDNNSGNTPAYDDTVYRVIFDTDIGSSTDDLFALKLLYFYADRGEFELIGGIVSREQEGNWEKFAKLADVMNTYYGYGDLPMGVDRNGVKTAIPFIDYAGIADLKNPDGSLMFKRSISDYSQLPEGYKLYRKLLAEQPNGMTKIFSLGFVSVLAQLLQSQGDEFSPLNGIELVKKKVHSLYVMAGKFGETGNDGLGYNFGSRNPDAREFARTMLRLWPNTVPVYYSPSPVGDAVEYPNEEVIADIDWTDVEPIKQTYMNYEVDDGQMMWDYLSALNSVAFGSDAIIEYSESGFVTMTDDDRLLFTPSPQGNCYYQKYSDDTKDDLVKSYLDLLKIITLYHKD